MTGLLAVRAAVLTALSDAGLTALAAYAGAARDDPGATVCVDVAGVESGPMALGGYLGQLLDGDTGAVREVYGLKMEATISLEVRAPAAADCERAMEAASDALNGALPSGLRLREESWEAVSWERASRRFLKRGSLRCTACFTASAEEGSGEFLDFTLKGVLRN